LIARKFVFNKNICVDKFSENYVYFNKFIQFASITDNFSRNEFVSLACIIDYELLLVFIINGGRYDNDGHNSVYIIIVFFWKYQTR